MPQKKADSTHELDCDPRNPSPLTLRVYQPPGSLPTTSHALAHRSSASIDERTTPGQIEKTSPRAGAIRVPNSVGIAVGTSLTGGPPHRSVRAELPHTAPTLDKDERIALRDKDAGFSDTEANVGRAFQTWPRSSGVPAATFVAEFSTRYTGSLSGTGLIVSSSKELRGSCTTPCRRSTARTRLPPDPNAPFVSACLSVLGASLSFSSTPRCGGW